MLHGQAWSTLQAIGSMVGLITGALVLLDRLTRGRPYLAWTAYRHQSGTATMQLVNTSSRHIYLFRCVCFPRNARASRFDSLGGTLSDMIGEERTVSLAPGEIRSIDVVFHAAGDPRGWTLVRVRWRRAGSMLDLPMFKVARWQTLYQFGEPDPKV